ncbi:XRE family transcriptional regulator [Fulvivirga sp. RKSG066]|uniref:helix-turn-helix domain-containing protein n=1 Tax=Fulvivirga aurantia TaxID=2529383 RepID=UPI0012BCC03F|nr:helix-turn-helix transcriptional regulator [Fulvivirga aurantia]MTI20512.1 XRE family transcriptional regulator [Fulvivirga aurantia]
MKQPQLGKQIAELRQAQGLTQEELVEKCNISVRTIQRIESGDVTPRSYTVKTIFNALDYDYASFVKEETDSHDSGQIRKNRTYLQLAIVAGIIYFIIGFPEGFMDYMRVAVDVSSQHVGGMNSFDDSVGYGFYTVVKILSVASAFAFLTGFFITARHFKLDLLKYSSLTFGIIIVLAGLIDIISLYFPSIDGPDLLMIEVIFLAIGGVFFGVTLAMSRSQIGDIALVAGVFEILVATFLITFVLSILSLILTLPAIITGLVLLYQVRKNMKEEAVAF